MKYRIAIGLLALSVSASVLGSLIVSRKPAVQPLAVLGTLRPFVLRDQEGRKVTLESFKGRVSVVDFVFTTCPGICPMLTHQMSVLEKNTRDLGNKVQFVSISVDPETDEPLVLQAYTKKLNIDLSRWVFVTGPLQAIEEVVVGGFKNQMGKRRVPASDPGEPDMIEVMHGENFMLVDAKGRLRAFHTAHNDQDLQEIRAQMLELLAK